MPDTELIERNLFCDCSSGQFARRLAQRRVADWQEWQARNAAENALRAERAKLAAAPKEIAGSPISYTLKDASLKALRAKARLENGEIDPEKRLAIEMAERLMGNGEISSKGVSRDSMLIFGPPGVGKTGCLMAVFLAWQQQGRDCYFVDFKHLMRMVRDGYKPLPGAPTAAEVINRACDVDVLFFDDIGHTWQEEISSHSVQVAGDIIRYRYGLKKTTLMTSNLDPNALSKQLTPEIFQRIAEFAKTVKMGGKVLRQLS